MFRKIAILSVLVFSVFFLSTAAFSQQSQLRPVSALAEFKAKFAVESAKVTTITSDFKQQKQLLALTETITSTGKFWFKRENKVRIDYLQPFVYRMIMNGDKMQVRDDQKASTINIRSNKLFQQVNRIMVDCVSGTILESRDFSSRVFEGDTFYQLELTPTSKTLRDFFQVIIVNVSKKDFSVDSIAMNEPTGDSTVITFTNKSLNQTVSDETFRF